MFYRPTACRSGLPALSAAVILMATGLCGEARAADYGFETDYRITLNGLPIGRATMRGSFEGDEYRIDGGAKLTGIAGMLFDYSSTAASAGRVSTGRLQPRAFSADASDGRSTTSVRMTLANNAVRQLRLDPPVDPSEASHPARVAIAEAHRRGIIDPMSAMVAFGGFDGGGFKRSLCDSVVPIFNGRERFDVKLEYSEIRTLTGSQSGSYSGPALVCQARYRAIAGHVADRDEIKYLEERMVFEVVLAPVGGSDLLVPYRVTMPTPLGTAAIEATSMKSSGALKNQAASAGRP